MLNLLEKLKALYQQLFSMQNEQTTQSKHLCDVAYAHVGEDLSPTQGVFACAQTVFTLLHLAFGDTYTTDSTKVAYDHFFVSNYYTRVLEPLPGDIAISPTDHGNGNMANGHMGVVGKDGVILSNNSYDSKLEVNYNLVSWKARYVDVGGFPMVFFRRIL